MGKVSSGILVWHKDGNDLKVLLVHPGGPFFLNKDAGAWSIPKGECMQDEDLLAAALREFTEELGMAVSGNFTAFTPIKQKGGKIVHAWAVKNELDIKKFSSNTFTIEWPPRSGRMREFPEVDRAEWFGIAEARQKINAAQAAFIDELVQKENVGELNE